MRDGRATGSTGATNGNRRNATGATARRGLRVEWAFVLGRRR
jgi:hypothetical protein